MEAISLLTDHSKELNKQVEENTNTKIKIKGVTKKIKKAVNLLNMYIVKS